MQPFDIITALTLGGIVAILALYMLVVYKKGWIRRDSKGSKTYYLCPNTKCRRVFKEPIWLTDLSKMPPESFQSCPHCGINLQTPPSFSFRTNAESKTATHPQLIHVGDQTSKGMQHHQRESTKQITPKIDMHVQSPRQADPKPAIKTQATQTSYSEMHVPTTAKSIPTLQKHEEKKPVASSKSCQHYLGYVRTLPKSTPIPDECMWCSLIVKCLTGADKIEA